MALIPGLRNPDARMEASRTKTSGSGLNAHGQPIVRAQNKGLQNPFARQNQAARIKR